MGVSLGSFKCFAADAKGIEKLAITGGDSSTFADMGVSAGRSGHWDEAVENLKKAVVMGSMVASFTVEDFGLERLRRLSLLEIQERLALFKKICTF